MRIRLFVLILFLAAPSFAQVVRSIDDGSLTFFVHNNGTFGYDPYETKGEIWGLYYPGDSRRGLMAGGGIWVAGKVGGDWRITISGDASEFVPGPRRDEGVEVDSAFPIYRITRNENYELNDDYGNWPAALGAPVNALGQPLQIGSQGLWTMFNDGDSASHVFQGFSSVQPLGVEVRLHAYTWDNNFQLYDTLMAQVIFLDYTITNVSDSTIDSCIISIFADPDIGFSRNDRLGSSPDLQAAYIYDEADFDSDYGDYPPVVGMTMLRNRALSANFYYGCSSQYPECIPVDTLPEVINLINGLRANGLPHFDPVTSLPKRYPFDGNPADSTGWIADLSRDYRFLLNTIPDTLQPGESINLTAALVVARGNSTRDGIGKWLEFVGRLRSLYAADTLAPVVAAFGQSTFVLRGRSLKGHDWGGRFLGGGMDIAPIYLGGSNGQPHIVSQILEFPRIDTQKIRRFVREGSELVYRGDSDAPLTLKLIDGLVDFELFYIDVDNDGMPIGTLGKWDPFLTTTMRLREGPLTYQNSSMALFEDSLFVAIELDETPTSSRESWLNISPRVYYPALAIINDSLTMYEPSADGYDERTLEIANVSQFTTEISCNSSDPLRLIATPAQLTLGAGQTGWIRLQLSGSRSGEDKLNLQFMSANLNLEQRLIAVYVQRAQGSAGDLNADAALSVADIVEMLRVLYRGAPINVPLRVVDANCDSRFNLVDLILFLNHLFEGAPLPCLE